MAFKSVFVVAVLLVTASCVLGIEHKCIHDEIQATVERTRSFVRYPDGAW